MEQKKVLPMATLVELLAVTKACSMALRMDSMREQKMGQQKAHRWDQRMESLREH